MKNNFIKITFRTGFILLVMLTVSCSSGNKSEKGSGILPNTVRLIDIDDSKSINLGSKDLKLDLDSIIDKSSIEFIQLETSPKSIFGFANEIINNNTSYIIVDYGLSTCLEFSKTGAFLKRIGAKGRGPGEYQQIVEARLNKGAKTLEVYDRSLTLLSYSLQTGDYLTKTKVLSEKFSAFYYYPLAKDTYALYDNFSSRSGSHNRFGYLKNSELLYVSLPYNNKGKVPLIYGSHDIFYSYQDSIRFFERFKPIIYNITDQGLQPLYKFSFKSTSGTEIDLNNAAEDLKKPEVLEKLVYLNKVMESNKYLFIDFSILQDQADRYCLYDKNTQKVTSVSYNDYYIKALDLYFRIKKIEDDFVYATVEADKIIKLQDKIRKSEQVKQSPLIDKLMQLEVSMADNDILMVMKLK